MKAGVTKKQFIQKLEDVMVLTRADIVRLELANDDTVLIHYAGGGIRPVNIALDSGMAIIRDVAKHAD